MTATVALSPKLTALPSADGGREELRATGTNSTGVDAGNRAERRAENALKTGGILGHSDAPRGTAPGPRIGVARHSGISASVVSGFTAAALAGVAVSIQHR